MAQRFDKAKEYTKKYKQLLLPCKYCKSNDIYICSDRMLFGDNKNYWSVSCSTRGCDCTGFYTSVKKSNTKMERAATIRKEMDMEKLSNKELVLALKICFDLDGRIECNNCPVRGIVRSMDEVVDCERALIAEAVRRLLVVEG